LPHFAGTIDGGSSVTGGLEVSVAMKIVVIGFGAVARAVLNEVDVRP
jgi:hypothetical protein